MQNPDRYATPRLAIGDIHGRPFWKNYLDADFLEYFLLGDYFDSFAIPFEKQMSNFLEIVLAARHDARIKLCLGNHDYQYLINNRQERYSGFQGRHAQEIQAVLSQNSDLWQIVYVRDTTIISHAGLSKTFMTNHTIQHPLDINEVFKKDRRLLAFCGYNSSGNDITQGPLWIRPPSLLCDALEGYSQIVGHTPVSEIQVLDLPATNTAGSTLTLIDTHDTESVLWF
jgi:hypothetical protein